MQARFAASQVNLVERDIGFVPPLLAIDGHMLDVAFLKVPFLQDGLITTVGDHALEGGGYDLGQLKIGLVQAHSSSFLCSLRPAPPGQKMRCSHLLFERPEGMFNCLFAHPYHFRRIAQSPPHFF